MTGDPERVTFRIHGARSRWRIESWYADPPYGPGWQPLVTGYGSQAEALTDFAAMYGGQDIRWTAVLTGSFRPFGEEPTT